jgi:hypothetical protein
MDHRYIIVNRFYGLLMEITVFIAVTQYTAACLYTFWRNLLPSFWKTVISIQILYEFWFTLPQHKLRDGEAMYDKFNAINTYLAGHSDRAV